MQAGTGVAPTLVVQLRELASKGVLHLDAPAAHLAGGGGGAQAGAPAVAAASETGQQLVSYSRWTAKLLCHAQEPSLHLSPLPKPEHSAQHSATNKKNPEQALCPPPCPHPPLHPPTLSTQPGICTSPISLQESVMRLWLQASATSTLSPACRGAAGGSQRRKSWGWGEVARPPPNLTPPTPAPHLELLEGPETIHKQVQLATGLQQGVGWGEVGWGGWAQKSMRAGSRRGREGSKSCEKWGQGQAVVVVVVVVVGRGGPRADRQQQQAGQPAHARGLPWPAAALGGGLGCPPAPRPVELRSLV